MLYIVRKQRSQITLLIFFPGYIVNTAIRNNNSTSAIGDNVLASAKITQPRKKIVPKLKLGFRMADAVILLSHRKVLG